MARNITSILRDIEMVDKSKHLTTQQKEKAIADLKREAAEAVGQTSLDLTPPKGGKTAPQA